MNQPQLLDFVKAMSDPDRLRIIGALSQGPRTASRIAELLNLSFRKTVNHLAFLTHVGVVLVHAESRRQDDLYELDSKFLERLARLQFEGARPVYVPAADMEKKTRRVLASYLNADGTIGQIPLQPGKLRIILNYILNAFETNKVYTEKEINAILIRFNEDVASLRRYLVDAGMLVREQDGSKYWRGTETVDRGWYER
jgi:ArsR family transcriptional regulator